MGSVKFQPGSVPSASLPALPATPGATADARITIGSMRMLKPGHAGQQATLTQALDRQSTGVKASRQQVDQQLNAASTGLALISIKSANPPGALDHLLSKLQQFLTKPTLASKAAQDPAQALTSRLASAPAELRAHPNWGNVERRLQTYLATTEPMQHPDFSTLLNSPNIDLFKLVGSLKAFSKLDAATSQQVACQRELANIGMQDIGAIIASSAKGSDLNKAVLGNEKSFISANADHDAVKPGNQVSLAMNTVLLRADGTPVKVTVLSSPAPALDSSLQPEWDKYVDAGGKLKPDAYQKSMDAIKDHILSCAASHAGKRVVLTGIGTGAFLSGLPEKEKAAARAIVTSVLADTAKELDKLGKQVAFYDRTETFCETLNAINGGTPDIAFLGKLEGNWERQGDLILNAWDPHSLIGNGLAQDNSADGMLCRHTLLHLQHAIACVLRTEGML